MSQAALSAEKLQSLPEADVRTALVQRNPKASKAAINRMAKFLAAVSRIAADLPPGEQRKLPTGQKRLRLALLEATGNADEQDDAVETSVGEGRGELLSVEEGLQRLRRYAPPRPIEEWAGPVGGAGEIESELGIPRSTLSEWYRRGAVIGLLRGERKRVYPLEQFIDGRPIEGVGKVARIAPDARAAWLWLRQPHGRLDKLTPIELLARGDREVVVEVAERDFL
jgi:hypothetical protein